MWVFSKLTTIYANPCSGKVCDLTFRNMWQNAIPVNEKSLKLFLLQVFYNPFISQTKNGLKYIWTLLLVFLPMKKNMIYFSSSID
jgi:hypothetical protein